MSDNTETIARKILDGDPKYNGYTITANYHTIGTNVDTVEAKIDNLTITLMIDHYSGKLLHKSESRAYERSFIEPHIPVTDTISVQSSAYFELEQPITIHGDKINSNDIELVFDQSNPNTLVGFRILLKTGTDDEIESAYQRARRLTNFLGLKTGVYLDHKRLETLIVKSDHMTRTKSFTVGVNLSKWIDLDLTNNNLIKLIRDDNPLLTQQIADAIAGFQAFDDKNFKDAIRNFWLVVENEGLTLQKDYKSLRDGLSHPEINNTDAIDALRDDFHIVYKIKLDSVKNPKGVYVDINDLNNRRIIREEATFLREQVIKLLESKL